MIGTKLFVVSILTTVLIVAASVGVIYDSSAPTSVTTTQTQTNTQTSIKSFTVTSSVTVAQGAAVTSTVTSTSTSTVTSELNFTTTRTATDTVIVPPVTKTAISTTVTVTDTVTTTSTSTTQPGLSASLSMDPASPVPLYAGETGTLDLNFNNTGPVAQAFVYPSLVGSPVFGISLELSTPSQIQVPSGRSLVTLFLQTNGTALSGSYQVQVDVLSQYSGVNAYGEVGVREPFSVNGSVFGSEVVAPQFADCAGTNTTSTWNESCALPLSSSNPGLLAFNLDNKSPLPVCVKWSATAPTGTTVTFKTASQLAFCSGGSLMIPGNTKGQTFQIELTVTSSASSLQTVVVDFTR